MPELSATRKLQQRFWDGFCRSLGRDDNLTCEPWDAGMGHAMNVSVGRHHDLTLRFNVRDRRMEADLTLKGDAAKRHFASLRERFHDQAEELLGQGVEWQPEVPNRPNYPTPRKPEAHIRLKRVIDPHKESDWPEQWAWLRTKANVLNDWLVALNIT